MIQISKLQLIETPEDFFNVDKILAVDVFPLGDTPRQVREVIKSNYGGFTYNKETYLPLTLKGSPENLILKVQKGYVQKLATGMEIFIKMEGTLDDLIRDKKIYYFDNEYKASELVFAREIDFLIDRYILKKV